MMSPPKHTASLKWILLGCVATLTLAAVADFELQRLSNGHLFLLKMPWELAPSEVETEDARQSATENRIPAFLAIIVIGFIVVATGSGVSSRLTKERLLSRFVLSLFAVAVIADLLSTIWFFHSLGVEFEFHPAIRLFGYAYGRTFGPIAGKLIQAAGIIYVSALLKERGRYLLYVVSAAYLAAAVYNISQTI